jgi:hypothetical protein
VPFDFVAQLPVDLIPPEVVAANGITRERRRLLSFFVHLDFEERDEEAPLIHVAALVRVDSMFNLSVMQRPRAKPLLQETAIEVSLDVSLPGLIAQARVLDPSNAAAFLEADVLSDVIKEIERAWSGARHQIGGWSSETLNGDNEQLEESPLLQLDDGDLQLGVSAHDGVGDGFVRMFGRPGASPEGVTIPLRGTTSRSEE